MRFFSWLKTPADINSYTTDVPSQLLYHHSPPFFQFLSLRCLNEYVPGACGAMEYRKKLEAQGGSLLATEIRNNGFKVARWVCEALLAGVDFVKIGFVSRKSPSNPWAHVLVGMQTFGTQQLANQV